MKFKIGVIIITLILFQSCKSKTIEDKSQLIIESIKTGKTGVLKKFAIDGLLEAPNLAKFLEEYQTALQDLEIDKKENFIIKRELGRFKSDKVSLDSVIITTISVPLGVKMPSVIPSHFFNLNFVKDKGIDKLIGFNLNVVKTLQSSNNLDVLSKIYIDKKRIIDVDFIYEGGYKNPMIFKSKGSLVRELGKETEQFDLLLKMINNSKIVEVAKKNDAKRFKGDAELEIIKFKMNNNHEWILFSVISEERNKKEIKLGNYELRYSKYANIAVSYWINVEDVELFKKTLHRLAHSGSNIRTKLKKSVKLEVK